MASEGAKGEQPPPLQTLLTAGHGSVETKCELNMDNLSKPELLTLLSIMEGELEARDLVIEALRARRKEVFLQERYGHFSMTDPFLALQRDFESGGGHKERRAVSASPITVLEAVMAHCRKMQERMSAQLAAAENRQKRLELEKMQLQSLEQEHRKLSAQLKDEREKNKHVVMMLVRECKQLAARVVEESQRVEELSSSSEQEGRTSSRLEEELATERKRSQQMEAEMEKQLAEFDTEREQLRARLSREESRAAELRAESDSLRQQVKQLRTERGKDAPTLPPAAVSAPVATPVKPKSITSVAVGTEAASCRAAASQTEPLAENEMPKKLPLSIPVKPTGTNYTSMNLPKTPTTVRGLHHGSAQAENGAEGQMALNSAHSLHSPGTATALPTGSRVQAARYKFQPSASEQDQNGMSNQGPPSRDLSPTNRDNFAAKQQARHTVTQVLSRFTSPPTAGPPTALRPGLSHSASEGGPFAGRLGHPQIGIKSPTVARIDRGNPPPIPPKKPGLSQTPSPPHPPIKVVGEASRSPAIGLGVGPPKSASTPQLPPKPSLDLGGAVPALTASQVGEHCPGRQREPQTAAACVDCSPVTTTSSTIATIISSPSVNPASVPSHSPQHPGSPLAAASGWCPSIVPPLTCGEPVPLDDGHTLLLQAASQGNVTLLSMLLNQDPSMDVSHLQQDLTSALFSAAQNGHTECLNLLLSLGVSADAPDENGFTSLHIAAANGHHGCVRALLEHGTEVERECVGGQTALILAAEHGSAECVRALLDAGANRSHITADSCTALHAAVSSGHVDALKLLLYHPSPQAETGGSVDSIDAQHTHPRPVMTRHTLNLPNQDGWTAAHIAASRGYKKCLEVLCSHSQQDIEKRDKCNRTIHDVATDDCKDLLENLDCYRVVVQVYMGSHEHLCPVDVLEDGATIGTVSIQRRTSWPELWRILSQLLTDHLELVCGSWELQEGLGGTDIPLGLSSDSVASVKIGDAVWLPGQELAQSPWDLIRKRLSQRISIRLKGLSECALDEMTYDSLIPLPLLQNYVRLVEQYRNVIFHGLEGSFQEYIANQISHHIKHRQEAMGIGCDVIHVEIEEGLSKDHLLETFINCGFLVCVQEAAVGRCVVVVLEGLERAHSLSHMLENLCEALENRGSLYSLSLNHSVEGLYYFQEGSFLIGTLAKPRLQGAELRLQQHFRWVQLRWDTEPLSSMLGRHLRRKLLHKSQGQPWTPDDPVHRTLSWVCSVWQQLNSCLSRLGTPEALLGPYVFLSCPVLPEQRHAILKWLARLWNVLVVPRIEDAVISRVTAKHSPLQRRSPSNKGLSPGQRAVVRAALNIVLNKAVLHSCPLDRSEINQLLPEFRGGCFPLSSISYSYRKGGRKGRDSAAWRRSNTSPRKKTSPASGIGSNSSLQEGSVSNSEVHLMTNASHPRVSDGDSAGLTLYSDDESDLIRELQTLCSSKSEPDISKIAVSQEDFIMLPGPSQDAHRRKLEHSYSGLQAQASREDSSLDSTQPPVQQINSSHSENVHTSPRRVARPKSQLPIPSSKGHQQTPSSSHRATNTSNPAISSSIRPSQTHSSRAHMSSRTRQTQPNNRNKQPEEEIWILNSNFHKNYSNRE
ncbi:cortactin-binding protein 2 isoform X2 [Pangasianodon hypophthalmus]|uniref:cortactin-binding protein 2 isoform X2 n=1 Tax=Pangasianodon hypophthalmus TaxID=310915 RepID=UPI0023078463|nr:cortactin-binding protein 2 isoform X2 [Pangasianodon hypophthalmus]